MFKPVVFHVCSPSVADWGQCPFAGQEDWSDPTEGHPLGCTFQPQSSPDEGGKALNMQQRSGLVCSSGAVLQGLGVGIKWHFFRVFFRGKKPSVRTAVLGKDKSVRFASDVRVQNQLLLPASVCRMQGNPRRKMLP